MWIFGYGSLIWKVDFPHQQRVEGYIEGYCRRFWQGSTDHRGVPGKPGRVVTLVQSPKDRVWGIAYQLPVDEMNTVKDQLDYREKHGYDRRTVTFHPLDQSKQAFECQVYMCTPQSIGYLGPAPLEVIAEQISQSVGPSGANDEYVFELAKAVKLLFPTVQDDHLFDVENAVRRMKSTYQSH